MVIGAVSMLLCNVPSSDAERHRTTVVAVAYDDDEAPVSIRPRHAEREASAANLLREMLRDAEARYQRGER